MAEDEPKGLLHGKQALLVPHDEVVGLDIGSTVAACVLRALLGVDAEVAAVRQRHRRQIQGRVPRLRGEVAVCLLEPTTDRTERGVAIGIGGSVVGNLVDEEERQYLHAERRQGSLLVEMLTHRLDDLCPTDIFVERA